MWRLPLLASALLAGCYAAHGEDDAGAVAIDVRPTLDAVVERDTATALDAAVTPVDVPADAGPLPGRTIVYALGGLAMPGMVDHAVGLDLDGLVSSGSEPGCTGARDFLSPISHDDGIDNQISAHLVPRFRSLELFAYASFTADLAQTGVWLLAIELSGVESETSDPTVVARIFLAEPASGELVPEEYHWLAPHQEIRERVSLGATATAITGGELRFAIPGLSVPFPSRGEHVLVPLDHVEFGFGLTTRFGDRFIELGELGGRIDPVDLVPVFRGLGEDVGESAVREIVPPDLEPDGSGGCARISAGFDFHGVEMILVP